MLSTREHATAVLIAFSPLALAAAAFAANAGIPRPICRKASVSTFILSAAARRTSTWLAAAGFKFIRMDFSWGGHERVRGQYTWDEYDELTSNLEKRGLRALYILDYSNALYEEQIASRDPISARKSRRLRRRARRTASRPLHVGRPRRLSITQGRGVCGKSERAKHRFLEAETGGPGLRRPGFGHVPRDPRS